MPNAKKIELVREVTDKVNRAQVMVLADYRGMSVEQMEGLREKLRKSKAEFRVIKNRLYKIALGDNPALEQLREQLIGPTGVAFGYEDPVELAKEILAYAKEHEAVFELKGGVLGLAALDNDGLKALSKMPGLRELRGQMAGALKKPQTNMAVVLKKPVGQIAFASQNLRRKMVNAFQNYAAKLEEGGAEAA